MPQVTNSLKNAFVKISVDNHDVENVLGSETTNSRKPWKGFLSDKT
jgi:hypothetical protein